MSGEAMKDEMMLEGWLDIRSASTKLGVSIQAVHALCDRGTLAFKYLGGRRFVRFEALTKLAMDPNYQLRSRALSKRAIRELAGQNRLEDLS